MRVFSGNDSFLTPEYVCDRLRSVARDEAEADEYHPEEHLNWIAADMIERLNDVIDGKLPHLILHEIADQLEKRYREEQNG